MEGSPTCVDNTKDDLREALNKHTISYWTENHMVTALLMINSKYVR